MFNYMHVKSTAEHMLKCNSGATWCLQADNTHMALYRCPTLNAYRAFTHCSVKPAHLFYCSVEGLEGSIPVCCSPEQHCRRQRQENTLSPIMTLQPYAKPDPLCLLNCWISIGLTFHVKIHLTFSAGMLKTLSRPSPWPTLCPASQHPRRRKIK